MDVTAFQRFTLTGHDSGPFSSRGFPQEPKSLPRVGGTVHQAYRNRLQSPPQSGFWPGTELRAISRWAPPGDFFRVSRTLSLRLHLLLLLPLPGPAQASRVNSGLQVGRKVATLRLQPASPPGLARTEVSTELSLEEHLEFFDHGIERKRIGPASS